MRWRDHFIDPLAKALAVGIFACMTLTAWAMLSNRAPESTASRAREFDALPAMPLLAQSCEELRERDRRQAAVDAEMERIKKAAAAYQRGRRERERERREAPARKEAKREPDTCEKGVCK